MVKRCVGIDIGRSHLRAVQLARTPDGIVLERTFSTQMRRSTDSVPDILRSLTGEHGFDPSAEVAVSMPAHALFFGQIQTDTAGLQALEAGRVVALQDDLPIPAEQSIVRVCSARIMPHDTYSVLIAATSSELIREQLQSLAQAKLRPVVVDTPIMAVRKAVAWNHPTLTQGTVLILSVDESLISLAVLHDGHMLIVRNIPLPCDAAAECTVEQIVEIVEPEVEITWRKLFDSEPDSELCILLVCAPASANALAAALTRRLECRTIVADVYANIQRQAGTDADFSICVAEGLALGALSAPEEQRMDFLAAYNARTRPGAMLKRELLVCAALLVLTATAWTIGLFVQRSCLESEYARLKRQTRELFHQTLPEETNVVNPLAQLQQKLDEVRNGNNLFGGIRPGRPSPLEVMHALTAHTPTGGKIKLNDLLITVDSVQAMGSCDSFSALGEWQRRLGTVPGFDAVEVRNQKKDARTGRVHFTLSMSSIATGL